MSDLLRNILRFAVFILIQVFLLNKIPHLHRFITPYIYFLFLLWLPFSVSRQWLLIIGFLTGLTLDYFTMTPGLHTAACLLIAYVRPFLISVLTPKTLQNLITENLHPKPCFGRLIWYMFLCLHYYIMAIWSFGMAQLWKFSRFHY